MFFSNVEHCVGMNLDL